MVSSNKNTSISTHPCRIFNHNFHIPSFKTMSSMLGTPGLSPDLISSYTWNPIVISLVGCICAVFLFLSCYNILRQNSSLFRMMPFNNSPLGRLLNEAIANDISSEFQSRGLDSTILHSLPTIQFKKADGSKARQTDTDCAVCLSEYEEGQWLKSLPNCGHVFHIDCIDAWFQSHSNCPLCRSNVVSELNEQDGCYSLSMLPLLEALRREDVYRERWRSYAVTGTELVENSMVWHRLENAAQSQSESAVRLM